MSGGAHHTVWEGTSSPFDAQTWLIIAEACVHLSLAGQAPHYLAEDIHLVAAGPGRQLRSCTDRSCSVPRTYNTFVVRRQKLCRSRDLCVEQSAIASRDEKLSFQSFRSLLKTLWFTADHSAM